MVALIAIGKDFPSSLRNLFESLAAMREAAKKNGRDFNSWFMRVTSDTEDGVWLEVMHAEKVKTLRWGRYNPMTTYHLFTEGNCACSPQRQEIDVSNWLHEEEISDGELCVKCYKTLLG